MGVLPVLAVSAGKAPGGAAGPQNRVICLFWQSMQIAAMGVSLFTKDCNSAFEALGAVTISGFVRWLKTFK